MKVEPIILAGEHVRLEPMQPAHFEPLCRAGLIDELWEYTPSACRTPADMKRYIDTALDEAARGVSLPFVTIEQSGSEVIGSTRFANIDVQNRKAEIGWTWITPRWQRTQINTEAKFLMLTHAFETWKCIRVELKTDAINQRSRTAILRIGATEEGTLRNHRITDSGRFRDTVYFSVIDSEWPDVKQRLLNKLQGAE